LFFFIFVICIVSYADSPTAPDATLDGEYEVTAAEYRFPAEIDPDIRPDQKTEVWGKMFYPKGIHTFKDTLPIVVMLHGAHATCGTGSNPRIDNSCSYTQTGLCPEGYVPVPSHEGYDYLANHLASSGFVVISINANRGLNCDQGPPEDPGLLQARGKMILKHLSLLYQWSTKGGAPDSLGLGEEGLIGKLDFTQVGLLGHSIGGIAVKTAYNIYSDSTNGWAAKIPDLKIQAIFEIAAADLGAYADSMPIYLNAQNVAWNQLLPLCDGDVVNLEGRYPFERMLLNGNESSDAQKSVYEVWGANHNFFNTEWQESDATDCPVGSPIFDSHAIGSEKQRTIALATVPAFFRSHLGNRKDILFNQNFNPLYTLPSIVTNITQVDRDFTPSPSAKETLIIDDFDQGTGKNSSGNDNLANKITIQHEFLNPNTLPFPGVSYMDPQRAAFISWQQADKNTHFTAVFSQIGKDIHTYATIDFRIARKNNILNSEFITDFTIQIEDVLGHFSKPIKASDYDLLNGPGTPLPVLKTIRIPIAEFKQVDLTKIRAIKFTFDQTKTGAIYLANIRVNRTQGLGSDTLIKRSMMKNTMQKNSLFKRISIEEVPLSSNAVYIIKKNNKKTAYIEIHLKSQIPFYVRNLPPILQIGNKIFLRSYYSDLDWLKEITFILSENEYMHIDKNSEVTLFDGKIWHFGKLHTNQS